MPKELTYNISEGWINANMELLNITSESEKQYFLKIIDTLGDTIQLTFPNLYLLNEKGGTSPVFPKSIFAVSLKRRKDKKYLSTLGYIPSKDFSVIIPQIQGVRGQKPPQNWVEINLEGAIRYFKNIGFKKAIIPDATSIDGFVNPKGISSNYNILKHRERLIKIYNTIPEEKLGFKYDSATNTRSLNI